jgi:diguanylate cyclase (GGDEF)-like protein
MTFNSAEQIRSAIDREQLCDADNLLVQIFFSDENRLKELSVQLRNSLPRAIVIGICGSGGIMGSKIVSSDIVVSFCAFEQTRLVPFCFDTRNDNTGYEIGDLLRDSSIKGAIIFSDALQSRPEAMLKAIASRKRSLVIAGGVANSGDLTLQTRLIFGDKFLSGGVCGVGFDNPDLFITQNFRLAYQPIGKRMKVTKAHGGKLIALDHLPIKDVVSRYLGKSAAEKLPSSVARFPLLKLDETQVVARSPIAIDEDGSLIFCGSFNEGESVSFGLIDSEDICNTNGAWNALAGKEAEAIFIYSCHMRKLFLGKTLESEFGALNTTLPQCGLFTYGEFFSGGGQFNMLNQSTVALLISESATSRLELPQSVSHFVDRSAVKPLTTYLNAISEELGDTQSALRSCRISGEFADPLTGLADRNAFLLRVSELASPVIALINIDRFRDINSYYGYKTGDHLLIEIAELLKSLLPKGNELFKIGGDVFLILSQCSTLSDFAVSIEELQKRIAKTVFINDSFTAFSVRTTAAIACGNDQLLLRANGALHRARVKRLPLAIAQEDNEKTLETNLLLTHIIREAILTHNDYVVPYFQPIAAVDDGKVVKYEALMRLKNTHGMLFAPAQFLELAKRSRFYTDLTRLMFKNALAKFDRRVEGITLNLSAEDMQDDETMSDIFLLISSFNDPSRITIEITESEMIEDYGKVRECIFNMKQLGVKIAIDDFGSGYSNFAYLIQFQIDFLKIDGSIIEACDKHEKAFHTLSAIVDFAKRINVRTIAEFVSTKELAQKTKSAGVDYWQGYYIGQPSPL